MVDPNIELLRLAARQLGQLADELVFVGGSTTGLFLTDPTAAPLRTTKDVDAIVEAATYVEYIQFSERLQAAGFRPDTSEGAPLCRWISEPTILDVMPFDEASLGFTNVWYRDAIAYHETREIELNLVIRLVAPPYFVATKIEAFKGRGNSDFLGSSDIEDLISIVDGREELFDEIRSAASDVRSYIAEHFRGFLNTRGFIDAVPGHILPDEINQKRVVSVIERIRRISGLT